MKKSLILLLLLSIALLSLISCNNTDGGSEQGNGAEGVCIFTAEYDMGLHNTDKATLLLSGSTIFFNPEDYDLKPLVAGDLITVRTKGQLLIQESYPSNVVTDGVEIISITASYAEILELTVKQLGDIYTLSDESGKVSMLLANSSSVKKYIIFEDGTFEEVSEKHVGMTVYASGTYYNETSFFVRAYYAYNPRVTK